MRENKAMTLGDESLFLVLPVPMRRIDGVVHIESQAAHGLSQWAEHFPRVTAALVGYPESVARHLRAVAWAPFDGQPGQERVNLIELPLAYGLAPHFRHLHDTRRRLHRHIERARYLCFAVGGCFGDWGAVAARVAAHVGRPFAVWADRVEPRIIGRQALAKPSWPRRWKGLAYARLVGIYERRTMKKAALGLFNGKDTYEAYRANVANAFPVMDIHLSVADRLDEAAIMGLKGRQKLRIGYAGRAVDMKAPLQWLEVLRELARRGVDFEATWLGDGPLLDTMRRQAALAPLSGRVRLPGFVGDRESVLAAIRSWDVLLFTHITPESPRILMEAMVSATPIVGYESLYARDLVGDFGAKYLAPIGHAAELAAKLAQLAADRAELQRLRTATYRHSAGFNDKAAFKQRSDLIKTYLGEG